MSTEPPTVYSPVSVVQLPNFESCTSGVPNNQPADVKSDKIGDVFHALYAFNFNCQVSVKMWHRLLFHVPATGKN